VSDVIRLENVCKRLGKRKILKNISFTVEKGDSRRKDYAAKQDIGRVDVQIEAGKGQG
jgi:hypothetical protein